MARRPLWVSAVVFAALLAATLWVLRDRIAPEPESFFALKRRVPDTLLVAYGADTTVMVPGGPSGWWMIRPVRFPADGIITNALLTRLSDFPVEERRFPLLPEKMDTYGMRHPRAMVRAAYGEELAPDTLFIGAFSMNGTYDYVRVGSAPEVALADGRIAPSVIFKSSDEFRRSRLMPFHEGRAVELTLWGGPDAAPTVAAHKLPDGSWWVDSPYPGPGGGKEIKEYLTSLSHMHIEEYLRDVPGPLAPHGLDPPRQRVRVRTAAGQVLEAVLGDPLPDRELVYAGNPDAPYLYGVSPKYPPVLAVPHGYFRRRAVVPFGLGGVDSARVSGLAGERTVDLRAGRNPRFRETAGRWLLLKAEDFGRAEPAALRREGLDPARGVISWFSGGEILATVQVGRVAEGSRALRVVAGRHERSAGILFVDERQAGSLWKLLSEYAPEEDAVGSP